MQISVKVDVSGVLNMLRGHERQIPFTVAKALTATAKDAADAVTKSIPVRFDRPTNFTQKAVTIVPATKSNPVAVVLVKDAQAKYLEIEEEGGQRRPEPGSPINLPVKYRTNQYGNIARGAIKRMKGNKDFFVAGNNSKTRHLEPGIYKRPKYGTRRDGSKGTTGTLGHMAKGGGRKRGMSGLEMVIAFKKQAQYAPRFGMRATVEGAVKTAFQARLDEAVAYAISTAR